MLVGTLAPLAAQLRGEAEGDLRGGLAELAEALSACDADGEEELCRAVDESGVLAPLIARLERGLSDEHVLYLGLSALVNLADVGGAELCLRHGAFQLLLSLVDAPDANTRYYASAGLQNLTSDAFLISAFADELGDALDGAESRLAAVAQSDAADPQLEHIARCASGALANLAHVPTASEYTHSLTPSPSATSRADGDEEGGRADEAQRLALADDTSLDGKLRRAVLARIAYERETAEREASAARVLQAAHRRKSDARPDSSGTDPLHDEPPTAAGTRAREAARERMRGAADAAAAALASDRSDMSDFLGKVRPAVLALARQLADVAGAEDEAHAVECVRASGLLGPLSLLLLEDMGAADKRLAYVALSVLVNLADVGGAPLVHEHGGLELMLGQLRSDDLSIRYYAVAGVQNMSANVECAMRVRGTPAERLLEAMLDAEHGQIARCAAGALANIRRASRERRGVSVAAVAAADGGGVCAQPARRVDHSTAARAGKRHGATPVISVSAAADTATTPPRSAVDGSGDDGDDGAHVGVGALRALAALPVTGISLLYTVATFPFRPFFRAPARPSEAPPFSASTAAPS